MPEKEYILLKTIKSSGSLLLLRSMGLTPAQIAIMIQDQIQKGNLVAESDKLLLTVNGEKTLSEYMSNNKISTKDSWILPQKQFYVEPLRNDIIILPKKHL